MSFNNHFKESVWSTRIGRITPIWNPLSNARVRPYETWDSVVATFSPHNVVMFQVHRYLDPPILGVQRRLLGKGSTSRLPEPTPLIVYRTVSQVPPPLCSSMVIHYVTYTHLSLSLQWQWQDTHQHIDRGVYTYMTSYLVQTYRL
jgi:hypothetical protein